MQKPPPHRLRQLRAARGLTGLALAKLADVPQPQVWRFEHGTTPKGLVAAFKLAAALGVAVTDIWPELPQPAPQQRRRAVAEAVRARPTRTPKNQGKRKTGGK